VIIVAAQSAGNGIHAAIHSLSFHARRNKPTEVLQAALLRTARLIMRGEVFVPQAI
jgi:2-methylaconitate cis-trans-isomerase PrpF